MTTSLVSSFEGQLAMIKKGKEEHSKNPFTQEIFLCNSYIAGTQYYKKSFENGDISVNEKLSIKRTPWNTYDTFAIALYNEKGEQLGHIPRSDNEIFARLMDAGKSIVVYVNKVKQEEKWINVSIRIFLLDY